MLLPHVTFDYLQIVSAGPLEVAVHMKSLPVWPKDIFHHDMNAFYPRFSPVCDLIGVSMDFFPKRLENIKNERW